jgi:bifunctional DNA-binding transcriptional regulator/antitoxin component of YhaV-PrlF toxin-antitoxin module
MNEYRENFTMLLRVEGGTIQLPEAVCEYYPENSLYVGIGAGKTLKLYRRQEGEIFLRNCEGNVRLRVFAALLAHAVIREGRLAIPDQFLAYAGIESWGWVVLEVRDDRVVLHRAPECAGARE